MTAKDLKQWRDANGYSQSGLAEALSVHTMTVSRWERGAREIPPFLILSLKYLELKEGRPKQKQKVKLKPKSTPAQTKIKKEKVQQKKDVYGEYLQTWNRFLNSVFPKW